MLQSIFKSIINAKRLHRFALVSILLILQLLSNPANAHMLWVYQNADNPEQAVLVLSEEPQPDAKVSIEKIAVTQLFAFTDEGKTQVLTLQPAKTSYLLNIPTHQQTPIAGVCQYGVIQHGEADPYLLYYYPKLLRGPVEKSEPLGGPVKLELVPGGDNRFQLVYEGKPVADALVNLLTPNAASNERIKTDGNGWINFDYEAAGTYALWAGHTIDKSGEIEGEKYTLTKAYATLVFTK